MELSAPLSRRKLLRRVGGGAAGLVVAGGAVGTYARFVEPAWLDISQVHLTLPHLDAAFTGYRIVQISDIHMDAWMTPERLSEVVRTVNAQRADLIAITGDFVTVDAPAYAAQLTTVLSPLHAPDGVVAILGNHDYWSGSSSIRDVIHDSGMRDLTNAVHTLIRGNALLHIAGVDDIWSGNPQLDAVITQLPRSGAAILLAHEPDFADVSAATGRFDLQISGHTHGGQVRVPLYGPLRNVYLGEKYIAGRYHVGQMIQYTNRGLGMVTPRVRFSCRPEMTVFTLHAP